MGRVTGMDVMLLYGETAAWHMHVGSLAVLDPSTAPGPFDVEAVRAMLHERIPLAPQSRWKLQEMAGGLDQPALVDDDDFDLANHVRRAVVEPPGGPRELGRLAGEVMAEKLDRRRPLWEAWIIDGLQDGRFAVLTKMHHSVVDGVSGMALAALMLDVEPEPGPKETLAFAPPERPPGGIRGTVGGLARTLLTPVRGARYAMQLAEQGAVVARHLAHRTAAGLPFVTPKSAVNGPLTPRRTMAYVSVPFSDVARVKQAFDVKANDVILALVAGALRDWLRSSGQLPRRALVAEMPVSARPPGAEYDVGTRVANTFVSLATDIDDPVERLLAIHRSSADAKALQHDLAGHKHMNLSDVPPPALLRTAIGAYARSGLEARIPPIFTLIVSSVPGPPLDLYLAGAKVTGLYPMGPLIYGSGLNVSALRVGDRIDFGLAACPDVVDDPWAVGDRLPGALADLIARCGGDEVAA